MNILLVNTNRMKPAIGPIGLDYLADSLIAAEHEPHLLDLCFSSDIETDIGQALRRCTPRAIGVTVRNTDDCYFSSQAFFLSDIRQIVQILRRRSEAPIVLGGVGFSVAPVAALEFCGGDFGIAGEGEQAFPDLLAALEHQTGLARIPNLVFRADGVVRRNPPCSVDLAALPPRRRRFIDNARYFRTGGQAGFETKRGCPMRCVYCADPVAKGPATRLLPPAAVVAEVAALLAQGIDHLHTCDCEFNLPRHHAVEVCTALIRAGLGDKIRWYAYCCPSPFDDEMARLFRQAGGVGIDFGVDSGSDLILQRLGRHFTTRDLVSTARICRRHGIRFMYDLLLGAPGETLETVSETIGFMRRVEPDCIGLSLGLRVYDGTAVAQQIRQEGDLALNPNLRGVTRDNPGLLQPVFYLSPGVGTDLVQYVRELVAGDPRFFLPEESSEHQNYNYSDNAALVNAIEQGARGAYWDILRRMRQNC